MASYSKVKTPPKSVTTVSGGLNSIILNTMATIREVVGSTLGPGGKLVIIERQEIGMPNIITKDGVTVFKSLGFKDPTAHAIMEAARDAAVRTANDAGDGPQPLWSKILTPTGFVEMGTVKVGMDVCGTNGTIQKILGVYPKGQKEIVEISFESGRKVECCEDHLWTIRTVYGLGKPKTLTVKEMEKDFKKISNKRKYWQHKYYTPKTVVDFGSSDELPLDPYLVGVLIGDGSLCDSGSVELSLGKPKEHVINKLVLPKGIRLNSKYVEHKNSFRVKINGTTPDGSTIRDSLERIGLRNTDSYSKFIPKQYLYASVESRQKLLQGLIDTDGHINVKNCFEFSTVGDQLALDFEFLCRSLGKSLNYRLHIKKDGDGSYSKKPMHRFAQLKGNRYGDKIVNISRTGKFTEMQCIKVSNPDNLYITDNFVVTHNTSSSAILSEAIVRNMQGYCSANPKVSPQRAVRTLESLFKEVVEPTITKQSMKATKSMMHSIAQVSANGDSDLADAVTECFDLVGDDGNVTISEMSGESEYKVEKIDGFPIPRGYEDTMGKFFNEFINDKTNQRVFLEKPCFVLYHGSINDITTIVGFAEILEHKWQRNNKSPNVVLVATGFSENVLANLGNNFKHPNALKIVPLVAPLSPMPNGQFDFLEDLCAVTGALLYNPISEPLPGRISEQEIEDFDDSVFGGGDVTTFEMYRNKSTIVGKCLEDLILERVDQLKSQAKSAASILDKSIIEERIGKITGGIARLIVSGSSSGEIREKKDRAEDAVRAVQGAISKGCLPAGGWTLAKICAELQDLDEKNTERADIIEQILVPSLLDPIKQLYSNVGLNEEEVESTLLELQHKCETVNSKEAVIYNCMTNKWVKAKESGLLDSTPAVLEAIRNSLSIATLLGTLAACVVYHRDEILERQEARENMSFERSANTGLDG